VLLTYAVPTSLSETPVFQDQGIQEGAGRWYKAREQQDLMRLTTVVEFAAAVVGPLELPRDESICPPVYGGSWLCLFGSG